MEKKYYLKAPDNPRTVEVWGKNESEARADYREWAKISRLPKGTKVWLAK